MTCLLLSACTEPAPAPAVQEAATQPAAGTTVVEWRGDTGAGVQDFTTGQYAEALQEWEGAANAGDARAALFIGGMYDTGQGVTQDYAQALDWYRRAADGGSAAGMFNVAVMYDAGRGVAQDPAEAAHWYASAAEKGFGRAEYDLGLLYEAGIGVARDRRRAVQYFEAAAHHGVPAARAHLAELGRPFTGSVLRAEDFGQGDFQQALSKLRARSPAETAKTLAQLRPAAEAHDASAEYDLGYCYEHGVGVSADALAAYVWYHRAAVDAKTAGLRSVAEAAARGAEGEQSRPPPPAVPAR
ncbi:MAG: sel1 repeat family protein [Acidisphaera sp.]|nr:sel1 repeat family protein [Acidisphaera sp.]